MRTSSRDVDGADSSGFDAAQEDRMAVVKPTPHKNGKGFLWGVEEDARLNEMMREGLRREEIAALLSSEFGTTRNADAVKRRQEVLAKKAASPTPRPRRDAWTPEQTQRAFELLASGKTKPQVTKVLNSEFGVKRTVKAVDEHLHKQRRTLVKATALAKTLPDALVKPEPRELTAASIRGDRVVVPDGRAISVEFPMGQVRVSLQGELPLKAIRGIAEALVHAAIA